jgi:DNA helicase-2/ATP-dependent DNA helicase PcrA
VSITYSPVQLARLLRLPEPTSEQAAVIGAPLGPLAVIAGAGSGKSETMAARLVWLVANGMVRPDRVLGLTFTRKAAAEFADRVRSRLDRLRRAGLDLTAIAEAGHQDTGHQDTRQQDTRQQDAGELLSGEPVIGTYHAYAGRLVSDHALREGLEPSMRLITAALSWQLAASIVAAYDGPMEEVGWTPQTVTAAVLQLAGDLAEHLREPADVRSVGEWLIERRDALPGRVPASVRKIIDSQNARGQLLPLVERYTAAKAAREVLDHGDQVALASRIAHRHPEVGAAERGRYQVVLLDEYQDTSHAQLVLLRALFGGGHPVTAVGDPCQSIYGWRGASAGNLRRFVTDFPPRNGGVAPIRLLSTSFRNSGRVLDAASVLQAELRAEAPDVPVLVPAPDRAARGAVTCALLPTIFDEADWVADKTARLLALPDGSAPDGQLWPDRRAAGVRASDIAVLCRKRSQFIPLRRALEARDIPCEVVGLGGLLSVPEVQDVVATLRVVHDAAASDSLARLLTGPRWRIGPRDLVALGRRARGLARGDDPAMTVDDSSTVVKGEGAVGGGQCDIDHPQAGAEAAAEGVDALAEAVTDLTADNGSLVEALDDLGEPSAYSPTGYTRLQSFAGELRRLRAHAGRPLADLIAEVERTLGLDIEVAARPGSDLATARADLDAFTDVAATFTGEQPEPTLGAFLAYLTAAQQEEFGLETGQVPDTETVKLLTVHAAKGLQWPVVFVPGLAAGDRSQVFPARPRMSTKWTDNPRLIPYPLRGDVGDLPPLRSLEADDLAAFTEACNARDLAEERRLAYVAATRAAFWLGCSGFWWGEGAGRLGPSVFLEEVRSAADPDIWTDPPADETENPLLEAVEAAPWPRTPAGRRYEAVREAAAMVTAARGDLADPDSSHFDVTERQLIQAWRRDAELLLAERSRRRGDGIVPVELPARLSVSALVALARDPDELARQVRRPMPRPPAREARRGTEFHRWLEERFGQQRLFGDDDLFGDDPDEAQDQALEDLRTRFEAGAWGGRWPVQAEVPFETLIGDRQVRGRIDAVFASGDGGFDVVDWKTGSPPRSAAEKDAVAVQLAAYRLAWSALAGVPVDQVRAAFYYVRDDLTVRPADLLDEAGLRALIDRVPVESLRFDLHVAAAAGDPDRVAGGGVGRDVQRQRPAVGCGGHLVRAAGHVQRHGTSVGAHRDLVRCRGEGHHGIAAASRDRGGRGVHVLRGERPAVRFREQRPGQKVELQLTAAGGGGERPVHLDGSDRPALGGDGERPADPGNVGRPAAGVQVRPGDPGDVHRTALGGDGSGDVRRHGHREADGAVRDGTRRSGQAELPAGHLVTDRRRLVAVGDGFGDPDAGHRSGSHPHLAAVAVYGQAGDRLRHRHRPGQDPLGRRLHVPWRAPVGKEPGTGDRDRRHGDQAADAPEPAARVVYRAHGRSTVRRVGPPGGLTISNVPSTDSARLASPARPVPCTGSAPPTPSSVTMMCSRSPVRCTTTSAWDAWACLVMLVRPSETTK